MADDSSTGTNGSAEHGGLRGSDRLSAPPGRRRVLTAQGAIRRARAHVQEMTGRSPETVIGLERDDDHGWRVTVEGPQPARTSDWRQLPAEYIVHLDAAGELVSYRQSDHHVRDGVAKSLDRGFALTLGLGAGVDLNVDVSVLSADLLGLHVRGALTPPQSDSAPEQSGEPAPGELEPGQ